MKRYLPILAGLTFFVGPALISAQDYIDLEAERAVATPPASTAPATVDDPRSADAPSQANTSPSNTSDSNNSNLGELFYQLQILQQEVMLLRGQVEEQAHEIRQLKQQSLERYVDIDRRLNNGGGSAPTTGASGGVQPVAAAQELAGEGDAYRAAYSLVRSQKFKDAVSAFKQFLVDFPAGRFAPNAHYWLGELYLVITPQDLESSRQSFVLLLEQYPGNSKEADALYKLGKVYFQKGNADQARVYLDRVISEYGNSNSSAVKLARDFITENY